MATIEVSEFVATDAEACECGDAACYFCAPEYDAWLDEYMERWGYMMDDDYWEVDYEAMGLAPKE